MARGSGATARQKAKRRMMKARKKAEKKARYEAARLAGKQKKQAGITRKNIRYGKGSAGGFRAHPGTPPNAVQADKLLPNGQPKHPGRNRPAKGFDQATRTWS